MRERHTEREREREREGGREGGKEGGREREKTRERLYVCVCMRERNTSMRRPVCLKRQHNVLALAFSSVLLCHL